MPRDGSAAISRAPDRARVKVVKSDEAAKGPNGGHRSCAIGPTSRVPSLPGHDRFRRGHDQRCMIPLEAPMSSGGQHLRPIRVLGARSQRRQRRESLEGAFDDGFGRVNRGFAGQPVSRRPAGECSLGIVRISGGAAFPAARSRSASGVVREGENAVTGGVCGGRWVRQRGGEDRRPGRGGRGSCGGRRRLRGVV